MQDNSFCDNLNKLLETRKLTYSEEPELHYGIVMDQNENKIMTFPIIDHEEVHLFAKDCKCYTFLSICFEGTCSDVIQVDSGSLLQSRTWVSKFGNKPFADFNKTSWNIFFGVFYAMLEGVERHFIYEYSGWNADFDKYLYDNLLIEANSAIPIQTSLVKSEPLLSAKSDSEVCRRVHRIFQSLTNNPLIGYILFLYLLQSHCKQRFVERYRLGPEFTLELVAKTGFYKTSTAVATFNTIDAGLASFEDTLASIRRSFQERSAGAIILDDYKVSSAINDTKLEKIVRLGGDILTTGKYVSGNKVVDKLFTSMCVVTGEVRPHLQQSSYSRLLFVDLEQNPVDRTVLTELQQCKGDINSLVVLFAKYIIANDDFDNNVITLYQQYQDDLLRNLSYKGMHGRYYSMYGWFAAFWDIYVEFMGQHGVQVNFPFKEKFRDYILEQHNFYDDDPIKLFSRSFKALYEANTFVVVDHNNISSTSFDVALYPDRLFIKSGTVLAKVRNFWKEKGINFSCSERKLRQLLMAGDLLNNGNGKPTIEKKTRDNQSYSGYFLLKNLFLNYGGIENDQF